MSTPKRAYLYLAAGISLQVLAWGTIALTRSLALGEARVAEAAALQLAIVIVSLPIFLGHWRVAARHAEREPEERASAVRRLYLFATLALFLIPLLANAHGLLVALGAIALGLAPPADAPSAAASVLEPLLALLVLSALAAYHATVLARDRAAASETGTLATIRRAFVLLFSSLGTLLAALGAAPLLTLLLLHLLGEPSGGDDARVVLGAGARAILGVAVWAVAWRRAQASFRRGPDEERASALRKATLSGFLLASMVASLGAAATLLAGAFRRILGLGIGGQPAIVTSILLVGLVGWAFHALVLREDARAHVEVARQAAVHRVHRYLVTAIALAVLLVGLAGVIQVVVRGIVAAELGDALASQLAWSAALVAVSLPPWIAAWRGAEAAARRGGAIGLAERKSTARRAYLFFYLLVATVLVLASTVHLVYRVVAALIGLTGRPDAPTRLAESLGYGLVGAAVWLLHAYAVRGDDRAAEARRAERARATPALVLVGEATEGLGRAIARALQAAEPEMPLAVGGADEPSEARLVIAPWPAGEPAVAAAVAAHVREGAHVVWVPRPDGSGSWAGIDVPDEDEAVRQVVHAVERLLEDEDVGPARRWTPANVIGTAILAFLLLVVVVLPLTAFVLGGGLMDNLFG